MDHAGAGHLMPTAFAKTATRTILETAFSFADTAAKVHFERRFGKLEVEWSKPVFNPLTVKLTRKIVDGPLQVLDADPLINHQSFKLVEHRGMSDVLLAAIAFGDVKHANRRFAQSLHLAHLAV